MSVAIELDHFSNRICWSDQGVFSILQQHFDQAINWADNSQLCIRLKSLLDGLPDHITSRRVVVTIPNSVKPIDQKRLFDCGDFIGISIIRVIPSTTAAAFYLTANCNEEEKFWLIYCPSCDGVSWGLYEYCLVDGEHQLEVWMTRHDKSLSQMKQYFSKHYDMKYIYETIEISDPNASILGVLMYAAVLDGRIKDRIIFNNVDWDFGILANEISETFICEHCCCITSPVANIPVCRICHHSLTKHQLPMISAKQTSKLIFYSLTEPFSLKPTFQKRKIWLDKNVTRIPLAVTDNCGQVLFTRYIPKPIQRGALTSGLFDCRLTIHINEKERISFCSAKSHQQHEYFFFIYPKCNSIAVNNSDVVIDESIQTIELPTIQFSKCGTWLPILPLLSDEEIEELLHPLENHRATLKNSDEEALGNSDNSINSMQDRKLCTNYPALTENEIEALLHPFIEEED